MIKGSSSMDSPAVVGAQQAGRRWPPDNSLQPESPLLVPGTPPASERQRRPFVLMMDPQSCIAFVAPRSLAFDNVGVVLPS